MKSSKYKIKFSSDDHFSKEVALNDFNLLQQGATDPRFRGKKYPANSIPIKLVDNYGTPYGNPDYQGNPYYGYTIFNPHFLIRLPEPLEPLTDYTSTEAEHSIPNIDILSMQTGLPKDKIPEYLHKIEQKRIKAGILPKDYTYGQMYHRIDPSNPDHAKTHLTTLPRLPSTKPITIPYTRPQNKVPGFTLFSKEENVFPTGFPQGSMRSLIKKTRTPKNPTFVSGFNTKLHKQDAPELSAVQHKVLKRPVFREIPYDTITYADSMSLPHELRHVTAAVLNNQMYDPENLRGFPSSTLRNPRIHKLSKKDPYSYFQTRHEASGFETGLAHYIRRLFNNGMPMSNAREQQEAYKILKNPNYFFKDDPSLQTDFLRHQGHLKKYYNDEQRDQILREMSQRIPLNAHNKNLNSIKNPYYA